MTLTRKPEILIFIDWYSPAFRAGGPVQSIISLVQSLKDHFKFKIVTGNTDLDNKPFEEISPNIWIKQDDSIEIIYLERTAITIYQISELLRTEGYDLVYLNSFFSKFFSIVPLSLLKKNKSKKPLLLAPRGMLGPGALRIKPLKKKLFLAYSKLRGMHNDVIWHATSVQEEIEIKEVFGPKATIKVVSNIPKKLESVGARIKEAGVLQVCFISRISIKKNLLFALECLKAWENGTLRLNIYGPIEDEDYWRACENVIAELPDNIQVKYLGLLKPEEIQPALEKNHIFFLPTLNENFGHSIVEALMAGCPAIISDQTPWKDLEIYKAGYALPLNEPSRFITALEDFCKCSQSEFDERSKSAVRYIEEKLDVKHTIDQYKKLFNDCIKN